MAHQSIAFAPISFLFLPPAGGGIPVEAMQACPAESLGAHEGGPAAAVDFGRGLAEGVGVAAEALAGFRRAATAPGEVLEILARHAGLPVDHQATMTAVGTLSSGHLAPLSGSAALRIERALEIIRARQIAAAQLSGLSLAAPISVLWTGALALELAVDLPLDWHAAQAQARPPAVDHGRDMALPGTLPSDHQAGQAFASEIVIDPLATLDKAAELPVAWTGAMILEFSADLPLDWRGGVTAARTISINTVTMIFGGSDLSVEQLAEMIAARDIQTDFVAVVDKADVLPVDWDGVSGFVAGIARIFKRRAGPATRFADRPGRSWFPMKGARGRGVIFKRRK